MTAETTAPPLEVPAAERLTYCWPDFGRLSLEAVFRPTAEPQGAEANPEDRRRILAAVGKARRQQPAREAARLGADLDAARGKLAEAEGRAKQAAAAAAQALAAGVPPEAHEEAGAAAQREAAKQAARVATLTPLAAEARRKADAAVAAAADGEWRAVIAGHEERRRQLLDRLYAAVQPLAAELLAIDEAEASLYDAYTGNCPSWALAEST
jgi:hypothetical protein